MPDLPTVAETLGVVAVAAPFALLLALGLPALAGRALAERTVDRLTRLAVGLGLVAAVGVLAAMIGTGERYVPVDLGDWVHFDLAGGDSYHFHLMLVLTG